MDNYLERQKPQTKLIQKEKGNLIRPMYLFSIADVKQLTKIW